MDFIFDICDGMDFVMNTDTACSLADNQSPIKSAAISIDGISGKITNAEYVPSEAEEV